MARCYFFTLSFLNSPNCAVFFFANEFSVVKKGERRLGLLNGIVGSVWETRPVTESIEKKKRQWLKTNTLLENMNRFSIFMLIELYRRKNTFGARFRKFNYFGVVVLHTWLIRFWVLQYWGMSSTTCIISTCFLT